jgi:hypothetical protein
LVCGRGFIAFRGIFAFFDLYPLQSGRIFFRRVILGDLYPPASDFVPVGVQVDKNSVWVIAPPIFQLAKNKPLRVTNRASSEEQALASKFTYAKIFYKRLGRISIQSKGFQGPLCPTGFLGSLACGKFTHEGRALAL